MCGIVTLITSRGRPVHSSVLVEMNRRLTHRGPDDVGYAHVSVPDGSVSSWGANGPVNEELEGVLFGHRRLSILDLSEHGHQPMTNRDRSIVLTFNGEIYNFLELRKILEGDGVSFRGHSDTEVILAAYERWGVECFSRFNGMWALTLWDGRDKTVIACRDRFGIKPLYYTQAEGTWILASELKAIFGYPSLERHISEPNVFEFLTRGLVDHAPETLFSAIYAVPPGGFLRFHDGQITQHRYWKLESRRFLDDKEDGELIEEFRYLLSDAVRLRTRSDVPIGTMLSGGLDSTSITALIAGHKAKADFAALGNAAEGMKAFHQTFTACWPGDTELDEESTVDTLCDKFGLASVKIYPNAEVVRDLLLEVTNVLEQPFESPIPTVQFLLMREAKRHGVKVVLNGHGSDETLAGYPEFHAPAFLVELLLTAKPLASLKEYRAFRKLESFGLGRVSAELVRGLLPRRFRLPFVDFVKNRLEQSTGIFPPSAPLTSRHDETVAEVAREMSLLDAVLWRSFSERFVPQWLRMEDRVSMAHSVESRLPFMDHRLVEFNFRLPPTLKIRDGFTKYILRAAMRDALPDAIVMQKQKRRFATPFSDWFRGPWKPMLEDLLLTGNCRIQPFVELETLRAKVRRFLAGDNRAINQSTLWRLIHTELWLRCFS